MASKPLVVGFFLRAAATLMTLLVSGTAANAALLVRPTPAPPPTPVLTPSPAISASPVPSPSPSLLPSSGTSASPGASPFGSLALAKTRVQLNPSTVTSLQILGGTQPYSARSSETLVVDANIAAQASVIDLSAKANGHATVTVTDATGATVTASVLVGPNAGFVPQDVTLSLIGRPSNDFVIAQLHGAIERATQPLPGARVVIADPAVPPELGPDTSLDAAVRVHVDGADRYVDVDGLLNAHIVTATAFPVAPALLMYSDDPERIAADGVAFRATIDAARAARLYYYHQAAAEGRRIAIVLEAPDATASVDVIGHGAGPSAAVMYVGQSATYRYLDDHARAAGASFEIPAGGRIALYAGDRTLATNDLVAGVLDLAVRTGGPVRLSLVAFSSDADLTGLLAGGVLPSDGKHRRGTYDVSAIAPLALAYTAGTPEGDAVSLGGRGGALVNRDPGGAALVGDYGVLRPLRLQLANPTAAAATLYLYERPIGYPVTTTIAFDGDAAPTRLGCVKDAAVRYLVRTFVVAPGTTQTVTGTYMTDGGSTYPLVFGLTASPPSALPASMTAPDGCFPKSTDPAIVPPPPSPSPATSASPAAS